MNNYVSTKRPGNLASAFNSECKEELTNKFIKLKHELVSQVGKENLATAWNRLIKQFEEESTQIKELGSNSVPQIQFNQLLKNGGKFTPEFEKEIRKRGCVVIRNVVGVEEALKFKEDVKKYIAAHPGEIAGFPDENPQVWELYWSKSQVAARSHPNFQVATRAMNQLWHAAPMTPIDFSTNVAYCDRLRIRQKGDTSFTLNEHIDGGSVERWEDPEYRKCFAQILAGNWEEHDPFDATHRITANMDMYNCSGGCSMWRTFQGWLSLSNVKPGEGTLRVCPLIKLSTAYLIMRPLLDDLIDSKEMAGAIPGAQQHILPNLHPHIVENVVSIPEVNPGDVAFWHCDMIHAVEGVCKSLEDSSVLYIPATPLCPKNAEYVLRQKYAFLAGETPHDFPLNNCEVNFQDRATLKDLTELGKLTMGFSKFEILTTGTQNQNGHATESDDIQQSSNQARQYANKILGL